MTKREGKGVNGRTGLTLIEVLVALTLFTIVFVVLANTQILSLQVTRDSKQASVATETANAALEDAVGEIFRKILVDQLEIHAITEYYKCGYSNPSVDCTPSGTLDNGYSYTATITGMYQESPDPQFHPRTPDQYINEGLIEILVQVDGHSQATFTSYVSCYDVSDTLTLEEGQPCPDPYDPDKETQGS